MYLKFVKRVEKKKDNIIIMELMDMLISLIVVIISQCVLYENIKLYTLNIYSFYLSITLQ